MSIESKSSNIAKQTAEQFNYLLKAKEEVLKRELDRFELEEFINGFYKQLKSKIQDGPERESEEMELDIVFQGIKNKYGFISDSINKISSGKREIRLEPKIYSKFEDVLPILRADDIEKAVELFEKNSLISDLFNYFRLSEYYKKERKKVAMRDVDEHDDMSVYMNNAFVQYFSVLKSKNSRIDINGDNLSLDINPEFFDKDYDDGELYGKEGMFKGEIFDRIVSDFIIVDNNARNARILEENPNAETSSVINLNAKKAAEDELIKRIKASAKDRGSIEKVLSNDEEYKSFLKFKELIIRAYLTVNFPNKEADIKAVNLEVPRTVDKYINQQNGFSTKLRNKILDTYATGFSDTPIADAS